MMAAVVRRLHPLSSIGYVTDCAYREEFIAHFLNASVRTISSTRKMTKSRTYQDAIVALNSLQSNAQTIEKSRKERDVNAAKNIPWMEQLLRIVDIKTEDLDTLNVIHVSGTKGKGSTCAFTESLLRNLGYKTGFFSSPHLVAVRERIRLRGTPISEALFSSYFWTVFDRLSEECRPEEMPPYFKFLTVMSFYIFLKEKVDVAVVEVGIGGAYDSTNVVRNPVVCGVSSLGYDHMSLLGHTLPEIAWHKAGIFKPGCPAITVPQPADAMEVLKKQAEKIGSPLFLAPPLSSYSTENGPLKLGLDGDVQSLNASLALQLCKTWINRRGRIADAVETGLISDEPAELPPFLIKPILAEALETCKWPGRFQHITQDSVNFYIDGAHTKESVRYCADWYKATRPVGTSTRPVGTSTRRVLLFNSTADRKPEDLLRPLVDCSFDYALFCPNIMAQQISAASDVANFTVNQDQQLERCAMQEEVWRDLAKENGHPCITKCFQSVTDAFNWIASEKDVNVDCDFEILVTGSLHLVGALLTLLDPTLQKTL